MSRTCYLYLLTIVLLWSCGNKQVVPEGPVSPQAPPISDSLLAAQDNRLGLDFRESGQLDSAAFYFHRATESVRGEGISEEGEQYFRNAWEAYFAQDRFGDCLSISQRLRNLLDEQQDFLEMALVHYFDEEVYMKIREYRQALVNNQQRVKFLQLAEDTLNVVSVLITQARIKYYYLKDRQGTFRIMDELMLTVDGLPDNYKRLLYGEYGVYAYYEGTYEEALRYYLKGLDYARKTEEVPIKRSLLATAFCNIAEVCIEMQRYEQAGAYLDSVKTLGFTSIHRDLQESMLRYQLRLAALTNNDIGEVLDYLDTINNYQREQYVAKFNKELVALSKANEKEKVLLAEKQSTEISNLKLRSRLLFLLFLLPLIIVAALLFYRQRKLRFEQQSLLLQQRLLRSQMNPHFTFNILYAIQNLIKKSPKVAVKYLLKFSRLLRLILENSMLNYVQLDKELESLTKYMDLQLLRFPNKFTYNIILNTIEEEELIFIPPMLLQPMVENSIEHGFANIDYVGNIEIELSKQDGFIACRIEDDGIGMQPKAVEEKVSASTQLIADFLKKVTPETIEIINRNDFDTTQSGVRVKFLIPFKMSEND